MNPSVQPTLRWNTSFTTVEDLNNLRIPTTKGIETLDAFADITLQPAENTTSVWKEGSDQFIWVEIGSVEGVTEIDMVAAVREEVSMI
ncbi:hypothetical protein, partial [Jeotgalibacillus marinus]